MIYDSIRSSFIYKLPPFLVSMRFIKYCVVGLTGVVVNLGCLYELQRMSVHVNVASIVAIEISMISNFLLNHWWTFQDRCTQSSGIGVLALRFHMVCFIGAAIQFLLFVMMNMSWFLITANTESRTLYFTTTNGSATQWLWQAFIAPPSVGAFAYISQLTGIGVATLWNFVANNFWTWAGEGNAIS